MAIQSVFIINKSGGLVYNHNFIEPKGAMNSNDYLILAGTLHSVFAIASQLTPKAVQISNKAEQRADTQVPYIGGIGVSENRVAPTQLGSFMGPDYFQEPFTNWNKSGLRHMVTDEFSMFVFQSLTGIKFVLVSTNNFRNNTSVSIAENILRKVYCIYSDYVMKDPFYSLDMPIRSELFDRNLRSLIESL
ncbi:unnamed protein product [Kluyveromyces dobzhanskii CBS 2104]|uniref:Trafficking protein particle complex subunit n=1 Tax=Kluyveromyces dobzhanskii CBS 2104 TaxID=1427455 RepID=A0A0A8L6S6_9SACH|nr:unnamed protein product [Kluyveromyces dobzhanskii CBS 2104]